MICGLIFYKAVLHLQCHQLHCFIVSQSYKKNDNDYLRDKNLYIDESHVTVSCHDWSVYQRLDTSEGRFLCVLEYQLN